MPLHKISHFDKKKPSIITPKGAIHKRRHPLKGGGFVKR